jgi:uracil-DNA glycosylase family 4
MCAELSELLIQLDHEVRVCVKCDLSKGRKNAVPGEGNLRARVMLVGEAPGKEEDLLGKPFVGAAGRLLTHLLDSGKMRREDVYITNIVKCRPPQNRTPRSDEVSVCSGYLERQIKLINPRLLCPMGNVALRVFLGKDVSISRVHGQAIPMREGRLIYPLYHPAAALYTARLRATLEEDIKRMGELEG